MLSKVQILKLFSHPFLRRIVNGNGSPYFLYRNPICTVVESQQTTTESHELPGWVKFSDNQSPAENAESDDDFVIPSLADWVDAQMPNGRTEVMSHTLRENKDNDVESISKILKERYPSQEKLAQALNGCGFHVSNSLVEQILKRFSNDWATAFGFFRWAKMQTGYEHSLELYNFMVDILGKSKRFDLVWEFVADINQLEGYVTLATITKVMRRFAKAGKYQDAIEAFRRMELFGVNKDTAAMNLLMDALVKGNSVEHAHNVFLEFKDLIPLSSHSFNILIHGWCKARKFDQAHETMEDMKKHGFNPDVYSYNSFIEAYCREKDFRKVNEVCEKMKENGSPPNVVTYTLVMLALGKAGELTKALDLYEEMKRNNCVPDTPFYSSLIHILGQAGRLKDARDVFEDMPKQGVSRDALTYNTMISIACAHSLEETALKLLKEMEESSCKPEPGTYHPLLKMCCKKKRMKVLNFLLDHMFRNNLSLDVGTYALLVKDLCKIGKLERACSFFEEMVLQGLTPKDSTLKMLLEQLERKNMLQRKEHIESLMAHLRKQTI